MKTEGGESSGGGGGGYGGARMATEQKNSGVEPKVKRKINPPSQLEILERTYAMNAYPSEALRADLSVKLGLSDRQLQMWFGHRRLRNRKAPTENMQKQSASSSAAMGSSDDTMDEVVVNHADVAKCSGSDLSLSRCTDPPQRREAHKVGTDAPRISIESPPTRRFYEPPLALSEQRAIKFVEKLRETLREDGPILGMEFDPLPPGAFGAPIGQQRPDGRAYDPQLSAKITKIASRALPEKPSTPRAFTVNANIGSHHLVHPITGLANMSTTPERHVVLEQQRLEMKLKTEEVRLAKEVESHEKRIRTELEKQDILRKMREEQQMRKEMERQVRQRRKEDEKRRLREKQRENERYQREQKREIERREKDLQKEYIRL